MGLTRLFSCQVRTALWAGFQLLRWVGWGEELEPVFPERIWVRGEGKEHRKP